MEEHIKRRRAKKMILWFGILGMTMSFAGLISAYIVRSAEADWINEYQLPPIFTWSTGVILLSSLFIYYGRRNVLLNNRATGASFFLGAIALGSLFIILQFYGFEEIINQGYYFTGPASSVTTSFVYLIVVLHIAHVVSGLIALLVVTIKTVKGDYSTTDHLGLDLASTFWHFVDVLWLLLFMFFSFAQ